MEFDFYEELHSSQLNEHTLKDLCGISARTLQRWLESNTCPKYAQTIIACHGYDLGHFHKAFSNCYIDRYEGKLWLPDAPRPYSKTDILVIYHKWQWLHWYYDVWLKEENKLLYADDNSNVIQLEMPFSLKR